MNPSTAVNSIVGSPQAAGQMWNGLLGPRASSHATTPLKLDALAVDVNFVHHQVLVPGPDRGVNGHVGGAERRERPKQLALCVRVGDAGIRLRIRRQYDDEEKTDRQQTSECCRPCRPADGVGCTSNRWERAAEPRYSARSIFDGSIRAARRAGR